MKLLSAEKNGEIIIEEIEDASNFFRRFMGLMYRKSIPHMHGLLLTPCNEVHTFGMRFDIDVITLSKDNEILFIDKAVKPNKIRKKVNGGYKVLELNSGLSDELSLKAGDILDFKPRK